METTQEEEEEGDYIDMELPFASSITSPPQHPPREFEFQRSNLPEKDTSPSPADELFYKGKLLPLHLPPRLQMVQKLLQSSFENQRSNFQEEDEEMKQNLSFPFVLTKTSFTAPPTNSSTPLESCNVSPSESCRVSCELNPDEYFFHWSTEMSSFINHDHENQSNPKKSWSKKLKLMKNCCSLSQKLRSSRAYLRSLFSKSGCSDGSSTNARSEINGSSFLSKSKDYNLGNYIKFAKEKNPFENKNESSINNHRKSFSGAIKRPCGVVKCYSSSCSSSSSLSSASSSNCSSNSSSFSFKSSGFYELNLLKRSSSSNSEIENAIRGAIAHCKKSQEQQQCNAEKKSEEEGFEPCLLSASKGRTPEVCRI